MTSPPPAAPARLQLSDMSPALRVSAAKSGVVQLLAHSDAALARHAEDMHEGRMPTLDQRLAECAEAWRVGSDTAMEMIEA
jgi:hypothetical protein